MSSYAGYPDVVQRAVNQRRRQNLPGTMQNPLPGGTGQIPGPNQWKAADNQYEGSIRMPDYFKPGAVTGGGAPGGGGGGFGSDPGYQQFLAQLRAMGALDAGQRQTQIQQALIRFGLVPEGVKDPYGDVTDLVRGLAKEKTTAGLSTYARIQDWNKQVLARLKKVLAARGGLRSGELGYGLGRQDLGYRQTFDDALSGLMDYISGAQYAFAQGEIGRSMQQGNFLQNLAGSYVSDPFAAFAAPVAPSPVFQTPIANQFAPPPTATRTTPVFNQMPRPAQTTAPPSFRIPAI